MWKSWYDPLSLLFIDLSCSFLICIASLIHLSTLLLSRSMILAWSRSMTWLREMTWSVTAGDTTAIHIRKEQDKSMGSYQLSPIYDNLFAPKLSGEWRLDRPFQRRLSRSRNISSNQKRLFFNEFHFEIVYRSTYHLWVYSKKFSLAGLFSSMYGSCQCLLGTCFVWHSLSVSKQGETPCLDNSWKVQLLGCLSHTNSYQLLQTPLIKGISLDQTKCNTWSWMAIFVNDMCMCRHGGCGAAMRAMCIGLRYHRSVIICKSS